MFSLSDLLLARTLTLGALITAKLLCKYGIRQVHIKFFHTEILIYVHLGCGDILCRSDILCYHHDPAADGHKMWDFHKETWNHPSKSCLAKNM